MKRFTHEEQAARFWSKVDKRGPDECWLWTGRVDGWGYGCAWFGQRYRGSHRVSWALAAGPVPAGMSVCHRCDVPRCVNPGHLFLGTHAENMADMADMVAKGRAASGDANSARLHPGSVVRGSTNGRAKLTETAVVEIRAQIAGGATQAAVAQRFGVSDRAICDIALNRSWRHVA